ncbi:hypothetical protein HYW18_04175 [Candidatus Uhrbacteria bacterium]|nr:hypothetical protein [Candidatus Uhrbacteria bacterium]
MPEQNIKQKTLGLARHPGSWITAPLHRRYHRHYHGKHTYPKIVFGIDLTLFGIVIGTLASAAFVIFFGPARIIDQVDFTASVAPTEIRSGSPSTLLMEWQNTSKEELRDANITFLYPDHFLVQNLYFGGIETDQQTIRVGTIPPGGSGAVKIRGVMFGDVGGQQSFTTTLSGRYGKWNRRVQKSVTHDFVPGASALAISDTLPDTLVSGQDVEGVIMVANTSTIDFGAIAIRSRRTDFGFVAHDGDVRTRQEDGTVTWIIPSLKAASTRTLRVLGRAPNRTEESVEQWGFEAAFTFENSTYAQGKTVHDFRLIPSPLSANLEADHTFLNPGTDFSAHVTFKNIGEETLENIVYILEARSPFFAARDGEGTVYDRAKNRWRVEADLPRTLEPGEEVSARVRLPVRLSIPASSVQTHERLTGTVQSGASFALRSSGISIEVRSRELVLPITSPIALSSFGRYATAQGDQLGRGPLPPSVGEETRYWVFWNIAGTTNPIKNIVVEGTLPPYARFTGKQTISAGARVAKEGEYVRWKIPELAPNFAPGSPRAGAAFEIGVTPNEAHLGRPLSVLDEITLTGIDAVTGEIVRAFGARVTTNLPDDPMARGLGNVIATPEVIF